MKKNLIHFTLFEKLSHEEIINISNKFAKHIRNNMQKIKCILQKYETLHVVSDEINRTLDLLENLDENKKYFVRRCGSITSFLPKNQPLYAFTCFVIIPSLMAVDVHFRIPHSMKHFFNELIQILNVFSFFPNIIVNEKERIQFLEERSAVFYNSEKKMIQPVSHGVIFTGTSQHAEQLRTIFDKKTLFITNGSGHNPIVITDNANEEKAIEAILELSLYNQGQDCAAPNSILVHKKIFQHLLKKLKLKLSKIKSGSYEDDNTFVGPISDVKDLARIQEILISNIHWIDPETSGNIITKKSLVEPTLIIKPLKHGGNFTELFSPLIFIQEYDEDAQLSEYFNNPKYLPNAMYITCYGSSSFLRKFINDSKIRNRKLHPSTTILRNKHLHERGVERGTKPYGGYGPQASSITYLGKTISKPTLPQRDIYMYLIKPIKHYKVIIKKNHKNDILIKKDVKKILGIKRQEEKISKSNEPANDNFYIDLKTLKNEKNRYILIKEEKIFRIRQTVDVEVASNLSTEMINKIRRLHQYLNSHNEIDEKNIEKELYLIATSNIKNDNEKIYFFQNIYQLIFGKKNGPRLATFLSEVDKKTILGLIDI